MTRINKTNSTTYAEITTINRGAAHIAAIKQGEGFNTSYLATKQFKTEAGARRWVAQQFAI